MLATIAIRTHNESMTITESENHATRCVDPAKSANAMTDHCGWRVSQGRTVRAVYTANGYAIVTASHGTISWSSNVDLTPHIRSHSLSPSMRRRMPAAVRRTWGHAGTVVRLATPSLWEAVATAAVRQVVRASQARVLYSAMCDALGPVVTNDLGTEHGFPRPEQVLDACDEELLRMGLGFKRRTLRTLARAFHDDPDLEFSPLDSEIVADRLHRLPGVGPWSVGVAICDNRNEWDAYPYEDLAVRKWGTRHWASDWPELPADFRERWVEKTRPHTGVVTCFALASAAQV
jgi:DNA-3-methyladenine glycosylase II